jgi:hypothetical protein
VNLIFPVFYILATLFVTIVPMYASPVETGEHSLTMIHDIVAYTEKKIRLFIGTFASEYYVFFLLLLYFLSVENISRNSVLGYGCLMILSSVPVYLVFIAWKNKPKFFQKAVGKFNECNIICRRFKSSVRRNFRFL